MTASAPTAPTAAPVRVSFEFFPPKSEAAETRLWEAIRKLEPMDPAFVSVTYGAGGSTRERTHRTVQRISAETALVPAAHLTCVGSTREETLGILDSYREAGVGHVVALRGDAPEGFGAAYEPHPDGFSGSVELIEAIAGYGGDAFEITVSAYPEPHPESRGEAEDLALLKAKEEAGASRAITQFFFEPGLFLRFRDRCAAAGVSLPIVPGIMLQPNFKGLSRMAGMVQASLPDWLRELYGGLDEDAATRELITANVAADLTRRLSAEGVEDFHFYTLNRAELALSTCRLLGLFPQKEAA